MLRYADLDPILLPWVAQHGLSLYKECKDEEVRTIPVVDSVGNSYHIYARPDESGQVAVGADLVGHKEGHAFYRERKRFHYHQLVSLTALNSGLDEALDQVRKWINQKDGTAAYPKIAAERYDGS